ncbi:MAG: hypothetical protein ACTHU1_14080 [Arachnia sp.]
MQPIVKPVTNAQHPDRVLAQTVAGHSSWQQNEKGQIFDEDGVILTNTLDDLARVMRALGWFVPASAASSGVYWTAMPSGENENAERATAVHSMARQLGI